jgi:hypothetical protein
MSGQSAVAEENPVSSWQKHIEVQVVTTSGAFPAEGTVQESIHQPITVVLKRAQKDLQIADTTGWIVTVSGREVDQHKNYVDNGLKDAVKLDWGPREGGGGTARSHA